MNSYKFKKGDKVRINNKSGRMAQSYNNQTGVIDSVDSYDALSKYPYLVKLNGGGYAWLSQDETEADTTTIEPDRAPYLIALLIALIVLAYVCVMAFAKYRDCETPTGLPESGLNGRIE